MAWAIAIVGIEDEDALEGLPVAEQAYQRLLTLPHHAGMTTADVDDVVAALDKVTTAYWAG